MKIIKKITNGVLLLIIGVMHLNLAFSADGFGKQLKRFAESGFFRISQGINELPATVGKTDFETFAAFWFFYFGLMIIPIALFVHSIESKGKILPHYFTVSYFLVMLAGSYMVPNSGMTFIMLPHAIFMMIVNYYRARKQSLKKVKNVAFSG